MRTYRTGDWHAVVTPQAAGLFAEDMPFASLADLWRALHAEPGPGAVIGALVGSFGSSLGALPGFGAVFRDPSTDEVRLMVRGAARIRVVEVGGVEYEISGLGVSTWTERVVTNPARIELIGLGDGGVSLPLSDGVVAAGAFEWQLVDAPDGASVPRAAEPAAVESALDPVPESVPALAPITVPVPSPEPVHASEPLAEPVPEPEPVPAPESTPAPEPEPAPAAEESVSAFGMTETMTPFIDHTHAHAAIEATTGYDDLVFGETRLGTVEDAAVRAAAEPIDEPLDVIDPLADAAPEPADVVERPVVPSTPPAPSPAQPERRTLITAIPTASAPAAPGPSAQASMIQPPSPRAGDHDGETVSAEQVAALAAQAALRGDPHGAAAVTPPPPAGQRGAATLVMSTGERITLDRSAVIGRRPRAVRATGAIPHLVTVPSPNQDISRNHVELRVERGDVIATDLGTPNGTWLLRTGAEPLRLHPGEPALLVEGDRLDIGEGIVAGFEGL